MVWQHERKFFLGDSTALLPTPQDVYPYRNNLSDSGCPAVKTRKVYARGRKRLSVGSDPLWGGAGAETGENVEFDGNQFSVISRRARFPGSVLRLAFEAALLPTSRQFAT
jgi:hypothetical protein